MFVPFFVKFWKWKFLFKISLAILCPLLSRIYWPIHIPKKNCVWKFSKKKKKSDKFIRDPYLHFSLLICPNFVTIFCRVLIIKRIFEISLAIPRPSPSGIHWPINFTKNIEVSGNLKKIVLIGIHILAITGHMWKADTTVSPAASMP